MEKKTQYKHTGHLSISYYHQLRITYLGEN